MGVALTRGEAQLSGLLKILICLVTTPIGAFLCFLALHTVLHRLLRRVRPSVFALDPVLRGDRLAWDLALQGNRLWVATSRGLELYREAYAPFGILHQPLGASLAAALLDRHRLAREGWFDADVITQIWQAHLAVINPPLQRKQEQRPQRHQRPERHRRRPTCVAGGRREAGRSPRPAAPSSVPLPGSAT